MGGHGRHAEREVARATPPARGERPVAELAARAAARGGGAARGRVRAVLMMSRRPRATPPPVLMTAALPAAARRRSPPSPAHAYATGAAGGSARAGKRAAYDKKLKR